MILSEAEARRVYDFLRVIAGDRGMTVMEHNLARRIARDLDLPPLEYDP